MKEPSVNGSCRGREGGLEALNAHPPTGVTPRLSAEQKAQIPALLVKGAEAYGCARDVWTASRVAVVIERTDRGCAITAITLGDCCARRAGVDGHSIERATQRNEEALKEWSLQRWPAIKKSRRGQGHDQRGAMKPGFIRLSMAVRTWAPRGQTPILRVKLTRDHLICHQWHHSRWAIVHARASCLL